MSGLNGVTIAFAITGSFCSVAPCLDVMRVLASEGARITPVMSDAAYSTDTRFFKSADLRVKIGAVTGNRIITTVTEAEPLGPSSAADVIVIAPCTGNTLGKLAAGINDTAVTMAAKSLSRNGKPVVIAVSTNDGLSSSAANIGALLNRRGIYFVPFAQDDHAAKPRSLVARFEMIPKTIGDAIEGKQIQPILYNPTL